MSYVAVAAIVFTEYHNDGCVALYVNGSHLSALTTSESSQTKSDTIARNRKPLIILKLLPVTMSQKDITTANTRLHEL